MNKPSPSTMIFGGIVVAAGFLYATSPGFNRITNVLAAGFLGVGPEAEGCQRDGWWSLCMPPGGPYNLPSAPQQELTKGSLNLPDIIGPIEGFLRQGTKLQVRIAKRQVQLFAVVTENEATLSGPAFDYFWKVVRDPVFGDGNARCTPTGKEYQCYLVNKSGSGMWDLSRIAIRGGVAEPAPDAPAAYFKDKNWRWSSPTYGMPLQKL